MEPNLNGLNIYYNKASGTRFIPLPRGAWRSAGRCDCCVCKGTEGFWDTLSVPTSGSAYTVHWPELQNSQPETLIRQF